MPTRNGVIDIIETCIIIDETQLNRKASLLLAEHTGLPQSKIKDAMQKGAVWLHRGKVKQRLRRASKVLKVGDELALNYNPQILTQKVPEPQLVHDASDYSIWYKPFGLNCQGSRWGDFASIDRWVETHLSGLTNQGERSAFLVHRLDRATTGLILLAHTKNAARLFSEMFKEGKVDKRYQSIVKGDFSGFPEAYEVERSVDGKSARSIFTFVDQQDNCSLVDVALLTGRKHQIRQHLSSLGYPIIGDRLYGEASNDKDLQLQSLSLSFICPISQKKQFFIVDKQKRLTL